MQRLEIELGQVDAVPLERFQQAPHALLDRLGARWVGQVDELAPVELSVFERGGLLAAGRVIVPELLADMRQLEPSVDQHSLAAASGDQLLQIGIALRVGVVEMPGADMHPCHARLAPAPRQIRRIGP